MPALRLRFSDLETGAAITPKLVRVFYMWWAYMLRGGEWQTNYEIFDCYPLGDELVIPSYEVRPRSWDRYRFSFLPWNKPSFSNIEVDVDTGTISRRIIIQRRYMKRFGVRRCMSR